MANPADSDNEKSYKEMRIRDITFAYYSRLDVRKIMYEFSKNRECVPRYFEGFGKRPDILQYDNDILEQVKKGATSFHCSEELWRDPLELSTELNRKDFDEIRIGWDLLLDIDSPYLEYSKIYAKLLISLLEFHGLKNIGVKFSGSKGFHIIIPWNSFPKEIYGQKTKNMFPEWPRIICEYLSNAIKPKLENELLKDIDIKDIALRTGKKEEELRVLECNICKRPATKKFLILWVCPFCRNEISTLEGLYNNKRKSKCPECRKELEEKSRKEIYVCEFCNIDSRKNPDSFGNVKKIGMTGDKRVVKDEFKSKLYIDTDLVLVAPRHLFRMPYSLHEKTALSSIVIDKDKIMDFQITDARPFKMQIKEYYPKSKSDEARELLLQALEWKEEQDKNEKILEQTKNINESDINKKIKSSDGYKRIEIPNPSNELYPPCIKLILKGMKQDGKKRGLFILINYFKSLGVADSDVEKRIYEWNEKNELPLKKGYVQSQLSWFKRNSPKMPQNCLNPIYKDIGVCNPDNLCKLIKNPITYTTKKYFGK